MRHIGRDELDDPPSHNDIRIAPMVQGSKSAGLQVLTDIALIDAAVLVPSVGAAAAGSFFASGAWGVVGSIGLSLALGGVAQMVVGT